MNYRLVAIATLVIAPILATVASRVTQIFPTKQAQNVAAPVAEEQLTAVPTAVPTTAPTPAPMAAPAPGTTLEMGAPNPLAGQPMVGAGAPSVSAVAAVPPPPPPAGILPPYQGQYREPAGGPINLPNGGTAG